jgi:hypothetical protein
MPASKNKQISARQAESVAAETVRARARQDIALQEFTKRFGPSLEMAAKRAMDSIRHIEAVVFDEESPDDRLLKSRDLLASAIRLIVDAGTTKKGNAS